LIKIKENRFFLINISSHYLIITLLHYYIITLSNQNISAIIHRTLPPPTRSIVGMEMTMSSL